jgi:hypothetical protein
MASQPKKPVPPGRLYTHINGVFCVTALEAARRYNISRTTVQKRMKVAGVSPYAVQDTGTGGKDVHFFIWAKVQDVLGPVPGPAPAEKVENVAPAGGKVAVVTEVARLVNSFGLHEVEQAVYYLTS